MSLATFFSVFLLFPIYALLLIVVTAPEPYNLYALTLQMLLLVVQIFCVIKSTWFE